MSQPMSGTEGALLGMGNPLLDISSKVDKALLDKYGLSNGNQILAEDKHLPLYKELSERPDVQYIAGGATQNTIRVAQWMLGAKGSAAYVGCVGKDEYADKMREVGEKAGVTLQYMVDEKTPTGTCAVCVVDDDRSLVANLGAANNYQVEHMKSAEVSALLEKAKVVYSAGFFITACPAAIQACADHCAEKKKTYAVNISAPFICEVPPFKETLKYAISKADFLFGNETEAVAFAKSEGWEVDEMPNVEQIAAKISKTYDNDKNLRVVITQGKDPTLVASRGEVQKFEVPPVGASQIVDTNGAGDAFVGGFLAAHIKGHDLASCCKAGNFAASTIIKTSGTACPDTCDFKL